MTKRSLALVVLVVALAVSIGLAARPLLGAVPRGAVVVAATPTAGATVDARSITVTGQGRVTIAPDLAYATFAVETRNTDLAQAQADNATRMNAVLARLKSLGIAERDLQTVGYNVSPQYDKQDGKPTGYIVNNGVRAAVRDLAKLGPTIDAAVAAGANRVAGIAFDLADKGAATRQAREAAVADARAKAEQYATLANGTLGVVITISENVAAPVFQTDQRVAMPAAAPPDTPIETGQGTISLTVQVSYELK